MNKLILLLCILGFGVQAEGPSTQETLGYIEQRLNGPIARAAIQVNQSSFNGTLSTTIYGKGSVKIENGILTVILAQYSDRYESGIIIPNSMYQEIRSRIESTDRNHWFTEFNVDLSEASPNVTTLKKTASDFFTDGTSSSNAEFPLPNVNFVEIECTNGNCINVKESLGRGFYGKSLSERGINHDFSYDDDTLKEVTIIGAAQELDEKTFSGTKKIRIRVGEDSNRVANAFSHLINLHGGKEDPFAN